MLPRKKFKNLHAVMGISELFEYFSGKFLLKLLTLILSVFYHLLRMTLEALAVSSSPSTRHGDTDADCQGSFRLHLAFICMESMAGM